MSATLPTWSTPGHEQPSWITIQSVLNIPRENPSPLPITEDHSRKLLSRSKSKLFKPGAASRTPEEYVQTVALLDNYISTIRQRDIHKLEHMLADDIVLFADGGGKVKVVANTCTGAAAVAQLVLLAYHTYQSHSTIVFKWINHQPAFLYYNKGRLVVCQVFEVTLADSKILQINSILDPEKLKNLISSL